MQVVTLTTDFGLKDPYVAEMKGVILTLAPNSYIVDVTHDLKKFSVREGAFMLASAVSFFPKGTVHVGVVDPGVGTQRKPIIIETKRGFLVGPDNGLLSLAATAQGITQIREITNRKLMLTRVSSTFHGRDIFAPAAANLVKGVPLDSFGPEMAEILNPPFAEVTKNVDVWTGEILYIDSFGNIITNFPAKEFACIKYSTIQIELPKVKVKVRISKTYGEIDSGEPLILVGSQGFLEIAYNQGHAATKLKCKPGDKIRLMKRSRKNVESLDLNF